MGQHPPLDACKSKLSPHMQSENPYSEALNNILFCSPIIPACIHCRFLTSTPVQLPCTLNLNAIPELTYLSTLRSQHCPFFSAPSATSASSLPAQALKPPSLHDNYSQPNFTGSLPIHARLRKMSYHSRRTLHTNQKFYVRHKGSSAAHTLQATHSVQRKRGVPPSRNMPKPSSCVSGTVIISMSFTLPRASSNAVAVA